MYISPGGEPSRMSTPAELRLGSPRATRPTIPPPGAFRLPQLFAAVEGGIDDGVGAERAPVAAPWSRSMENANVRTPRIRNIVARKGPLSLRRKLLCTMPIVCYAHTQAP